MHTGRTLVRAAIAAAFACSVLAPVSAQAAPGWPGGRPVSLPSGGHSKTAEGARATAIPDSLLAARHSASRAASSATGRWIVGVTADTQAAASRAVEAAGGSVLDVGLGGRSLLVQFAAGEIASASKQSVLSSSGVRYMEPERTVRASYVPSDAYYGAEWGMPQIGAIEAWDSMMGSSDVRIAVVDTGVDLGHADLSARVDTQNDYDFVNDDAAAQDDYGHGSHVAGIAAASANNAWVVGVAPGCTILPVKVLNSGGWGSDYDCGQGIIWAADHGADVINCSFGGSGYSSAMYDACRYAWEHGSVVVAAAGNSSTSEPSYPAAYPNVISVSATDESDEIAEFSNYGSGIDISAPGVNILSVELGGSAVYMSGTSMASPAVAGSFGLLKSKYPDLTPAELAYQLYASAEDLGDRGWDQYYGDGRVEVGYAVARTPEANDWFPGVGAGAAWSYGALERGDYWDFRRVYLYKGQTLRATLTGDPGTDFDLQVYRATATDPAYDQVAGSWKSDYPDAVSYTAPGTGAYTVGVKYYSGHGDYSLKVQPTVALTAPAPAGSVRRMKLQTWSGVMKPHHSEGAHTVRLACYRYERGHYRLRKTVTATNADDDSYTRYRARFSLPTAATWRVVPETSADAAHSATKGPGRTVRVR